MRMNPLCASLGMALLSCTVSTPLLGIDAAVPPSDASRLDAAAFADVPRDAPRRDASGDVNADSADQGALDSGPPTPRLWSLHEERSLTARPIGTGIVRGFGHSVALSGNGRCLIVGDPEFGTAHEGAVMVFTRSATTAAFAATPTQTVTVPASLAFGASVAITPNALTLVAGAAPANRGAGRVYIYTRAAIANDFASPPQILQGPSGNDRFGHAVALSPDGRQLFVSDIGDGVTPTGGVQVYVRPSADVEFSGPPSYALVGPIGSGSFGASLSFGADGLHLAVGDSGYRAWRGDAGTDAGLGSAGAVHLYRRAAPDVDFSQVPASSLLAAEGSTAFGTAIALSTNAQNLFVGDPGDTSSSSPGSDGIVRVFTRNAVQDPFSPEALFSFVSPNASVAFGSSVTARPDGREVIVGDDLYAGGTGPGVGAVWTFVR